MVAAPAFTIVGKPIPRVEGPDKVSGRARYSADVALPGTLWARNVRSPLPHARIVSIDPSRALAVPGVRAVLTGADFPNKLIGRRLKDHPVLCDERVRFVGDKVAVVAAESADAAEEGVSLVDVEYEELPAVFDPLATMLPGAPVIHPNLRSYAGFPAEIPADSLNVCAYQVWDRGDVNAGFRDADIVVEHTFRTQLSHQGYLEPFACLVRLSPDASDHVEIWAANKVPYNLRAELATIIDLPESDIRINPPKIGADFGSKGAPGDVVTAYYLTRALGRPIRFVNSATEDLIAASPRHPSVITVRTGVKRDGRIVARSARVVFNSGAYGAFKPSANGMLGGGSRMGGCYEIPNLRTEAFCVYTNQVPCGYMRAPGSPQALFAEEAHMDLVARALGMDPVSLRARNLPSRSHEGTEDLSRRVLQAAADAIGLGESSHMPSQVDRPGKLVGRGISIANRGTGVGEGSSDVTLNPDGMIAVVSAMPDNGTGGLTVVAQVVAESLGVPMDRVRLEQASTDALPVDVGAGASRMTNVAGHAAIDACEQLKRQLAPLAAQALGAETVEWIGAEAAGAALLRTGGWRSPSGGFVSLEDLAVEMVRPGDPAAHAQVTITTPRSAGDVGYCAQAAEVEVDAETGAVYLRHMVSAQDVGTIINAIGHQSQIEGALIQGAGYALMEELVCEDGRIATSHLGDYKLPTVEDIPLLTTINIPGSGPGPFNAKSIGEIPIIPTAGAIANAVADAIGAPILQLPITAERVLAAIDGKAVRS